MAVKHIPTVSLQLYTKVTEKSITICFTTIISKNLTNVYLPLNLVAK